MTDKVIYEGMELPTVTVEIDGLICDKLTRIKPPVEAMIEMVIYLNRQKDKLAALSDMDKKLREMIKAHYDTIKPDERETIRSGAGMATYSRPGETTTIADRDAAVEALTDEQIRISYKPDVKALKTILKKAEFDRLTKTTPTPSRITIKDTKGEFDEF